VALRTRIHADICARFDRARNTFVQYYGAGEVDASLLLIPQLGFFPPDDLACEARSRPSSGTWWLMDW
jgi:GH15 family glucan-1,4-alpha-glucosidase